MSTLLCVIYILILCFCLYIYSNCRPFNFPPGPPRLPIWGSYWFLLWGDYKFPHKTLHRLYKKTKSDVLGFYLGPYPTVVTFSHELCKELLVRPEFQGRMDTFVPRLRGLGDLLGIFFVEGQYWKEQRRFALRHMRDFGFGRRSSVMEETVKDEIEYLIHILKNGVKLEQDKDISPNKGQALLPDVFYAGFINAIWIVMAGDTFARKDYRKLREIARAALAFQKAGDPMGGALTMTPWLRYFGPKIFGYIPCVDNNRVLLEFMKEAIKEHKNNFSVDLNRDFIDVYLSAMKKLDEKEVSSFTEEQLVLTTVDFLFPSATATTVVLAFLFEYLLLNPSIQTKVQKEIDSVVGRNRLPTLDDKPMMPYTEATIREGMRIEPLNPLGIARKCIEDSTLGGYFIPKGTMLLPSLYSINLDPKIWDRPELFKPERWLDEEGRLKKKDFTMPFGAGKRLCAGETFARQNMFLFFAGLMQNFSFQTPSNRTRPDLTKHIPGVSVSPASFLIEAIPRE